MDSTAAHPAPLSSRWPDLAKLDVESAQRCIPFKRGPRAQWLRCEGPAVARFVSWLHFHWPSARGQWRLMRTLAANESIHRRLRDVPFRSESGVRVRLDIASDAFLFLSGRLAPEPVEVELASRLVQPGDLFIDVGAHCGLYLLHVWSRLGPGGLYYALEPSPDTFRFLSASYDARDPTLRLVEAAASDRDGEAHLVASGDVADRVSREGGGTVVKTVRLDTLLGDEARAARRVFIKVDTEGHEACVIRGCAGLAAAGVRPILMIEFLREMFGQTREDVLRAIEETFGPVYDFWAIDADTGALTAFTATAELTGEIRNMIAVPRA